MDAGSSTPAQPGLPVLDRYLILKPPDEMSAIERRVADVIRHGFYLQEDSPPGMYLVIEEGGGFRVVAKYDGLEHGVSGDEGSESTTAVETISSVATTSTVECSPPRATVMALFKDMKISESGPAIRAEDDPPEVVGTYVDKLSYQERIKVGMEHREWKEALYCVEINIKIQGQDVRFDLQADSGATSTWIFHRQACELQKIEDHRPPVDGVACKLTLVAGSRRSRRRSALPQSYMPSYLAKHFEGRGYEDGAPVPVPSHFHYSRIVYNGKHTLIVGPMRSPIQFGIKNTYNWLTSGPDEEDMLHAAFSFAICDAAAKSVFEDLRMDGIIGFGPEINMSAFDARYRHEQDYGYHGSHYPSFSTVLQAHLPRIAGKDGGIVLYFYLNPPEVDRGYSFLAFNKFPAHLLRRSVRWTSPIYIPEPGRYRQRWIVLVKKIVIRLVVDDEYRSRGAGYEDRDLLIQFKEEGEQFHIDTGSSTTTLPPVGMDLLRANFDHGLPYDVPEWVDLRKSQVTYTFASRGSEITLVASARHFLCDDNRQGLLWEQKSKEPASEVTYYFGLNFFHSVIVAMHRPESGAETPYIRLGPMVHKANPLAAS